MTRFLACLMSFVLTVALLPTAAWGAGSRAVESGGATAVEGSAVEGAGAAEGAAAADGSAPAPGSLAAAADGSAPAPLAAAGSPLASSPLVTAAEDADGSATTSTWTPAETTAEAQALESLSDGFTVSRIGMGGSGAVFHPLISPFDHDTFIATCDMGGLYMSHDAGSNWKTFSLGGRIVTTAADPAQAGVFYAGGSGLWRTTDNGTTWNLLWPKPENVVNNVQSMLNHTRTYYFTSDLDSYPNQNIVLAVCVDPADSNHIAAVCSPGMGGYIGVHTLCESFDGGESFQVSARFRVEKKPKDTSIENARVFVQPAASGAGTGTDAGANTAARESLVVVALPDGIFALDRSAAEADVDSAMRMLYEAPGTIQDAAQVLESGEGGESGEGAEGAAETASGTAHYVVLENRETEARGMLQGETEARGMLQGETEARGMLQDASDELSDVRLWHATITPAAPAVAPAAPTFTNFVDLTGELVESLPRKYNSKKDGSGTDYEIVRHDAIMLCAPSLSRIYLGYRSRNLTNPSGESWQGVSGLVTYDAARPQGSRFEWTYGHRCYWNREDAGKRVASNQNHIMSHLASRGHVNANFTMLGIAADPRDDRRLVLTTHTGLFYSPDIDADVGLATRVDNEPRVNIYARYAVLADDDVTNGGRAANANEYRMRSTGLEVTVAKHVRVDPFDENHLVLCLDDVGIAHSYDKGGTWSHFYTKLPKIGDCCFDAVFDEGREGVVYGGWDQKGAGMYNPSSRFYEGKSVFAISTDGGISWNESYSTGLPDNAAVVNIAVSYPRDASGAIADGERTIYVATMGFGFYVSHDSGRTFAPMNAGVPAVGYTTGGVTYQSIWARDIMLTEDGRLFGMTQYSSLGPQVNGSATYHSTQDERTFGNMWEWDASANNGAGEWAKLPFNYAGAHVAGSVNVRQPRSFAYDAQTRTLYVAGVSVIGPYVSSGRWSNFGGGLYAYSDDAPGAGQGDAGQADAGQGQVERLAAPVSADACGESLAAIGFDAVGRMWLASEDGDVYYREGHGAIPESETAATSTAAGTDGTAGTGTGAGAAGAAGTSSTSGESSSASGWTQVFANALRINECLDFDVEGNVYLNTHGAGTIKIHSEPPADPDPSQTDPDPDPSQTDPDPSQTGTDPAQTDPEQGGPDPSQTDPEQGQTNPDPGQTDPNPDPNQTNPDPGNPGSPGEAISSTPSPSSPESPSGTGGTDQKDPTAGSESASINPGSASPGSTPSISPLPGSTGNAKTKVRAVTPKVMLSSKTLAYTGKVRRPGVLVRVAGKKLVFSSYRVTYVGARKNVGTYAVKVQLTGAYSGAKTVCFKIVPQGTTLSKLTVHERGFTAKWKKQPVKTDGYQLQYATNAQFKGARTITVQGAKATSRNVTNLNAAERYHVRVRTFKKVGGRTYHSAWSPAKS